MECEIAQCYKTAERIARKQYPCCECGVPIRKGELHTVCSGLWHGKFNTHRQHQACCQACEFIRDEFNDHECIPFGYLMEWWGDNKWQLSKASEAERKLRSLMAAILWRRREAV